MKSLKKQSHQKMQKGNFLSIRLYSLFIVFILFATTSWAQNQAQDGIKLSFSDGRADVVGVDNINAILHSVGVRVNTVPLPEKATPILKTSKTRALNKEEADKLISIVYLDRRGLLEQIEKAGRIPEAHRGGFLSTSEEKNGTLS